MFVEAPDDSIHSVFTNNTMEEKMGLKSCYNKNLDRLGDEITDLICHAQPSMKSDVPATCWSTNSQDVDVALSVLRAAGSSIHDGVTRFNLVFKANPGEEASASMAKEIGGFCQKMVSSLILLSSVGASKAMVKYCTISVRAVLHGLKDLVAALLDTTRRSQVNSLTGMVWQACKELQQAPKTNKLACRRQMMQWSVAIKDTIEEFQEVAKTAAASTSVGKSNAADDAGGTADLVERFGGLGASGEGAEEGDFDDFCGVDAGYSSSELSCVEASLNVLRVFRRCLKAANDALNTLESSQAKLRGDVDEKAEPGGEEWLRQRLRWAHSLQSCLEEINEEAGELGVLLYPPLSTIDLLARADNLERSLNEFCDAFGSPEDGGGKTGSGTGSPAAAPLRSTVGDKLGALRAALGRLES